MKNLLFFSFLALTFFVNSQNTSPFPSSGNVGIGTINPTEDLEVDGTILVESFLMDPLSSDTNFFKVGDVINGSTLRNFNMSRNFSNGDQVRFHIWNKSGKRRLDFVGDNDKTYFSLFDKNESVICSIHRDSSYGSYLQLPSSSSRIVIGGWANYLYSDGHKFVVKDGSAMIEGNILTNNNIGIGTALFTDGTETYRLSVDGKIRASGVKVYTGWADYVFESDYKLDTLKEVEDYIKKHGHLKDIPSAEVVAQNGIELGEMNKLLLQKIEELTLYTIELKKEVEVLKAKID